MRVWLRYAQTEPMGYVRVVDARDYGEHPGEGWVESQSPEADAERAEMVRIRGLVSAGQFPFKDEDWPRPIPVVDRPTSSRPDRECIVLWTGYGYPRGGMQMEPTGMSLEMLPPGTDWTPWLRLRLRLRDSHVEDEEDE